MGNSQNNDQDNFNELVEILKDYHAKYGSLAYYIFGLKYGESLKDINLSKLIVSAGITESMSKELSKAKRIYETIREDNIDITLFHNSIEKIESKIKRTHNFPLQQIFYGAPGTGKSHEIKKLTTGQKVIRTTFHPDSDYSTFVGCYKPTMRAVADKYKAVAGKDEEITYSFVPQAFLQAYVAAWNNIEEPVFLVIEEINRGNCAQIFGDLFQLLDRDGEGYSEYPIMADQDLAKYFYGKDENGQDVLTNKDGIKDGKLNLPKNLHIWATMNTSDQSLFPIDSAFKRRWEWKYIPIDTKKESWSIQADGVQYDWSDFLEKINAKIEAATASEDKMLGFYFCKAENSMISAERFVNKVAFYLWNDVFKDYGFDDAIFNDNNNEKLAFRKFYKADGKVDESKVKLFLENLGVESNVTVADGQGEQTDTL